MPPTAGITTAAAAALGSANSSIDYVTSSINPFIDNVTVALSVTNFNALSSNLSDNDALNSNTSDYDRLDGSGLDYDARNETDFFEGPTILEEKISHWLWLYLSPVLIFGGGIGNILAIIVLRSPLFRGTGTAFLLTALAVADFTVLMTNVLRHWIMDLADYDIRLPTDAGCRVHLFFAYFSPQWSAWTLVLVTVERAVSVWMPFRARELCSRQRIVIVWTLVSLILVAFNAPILAKNKLFIIASDVIENACEIDEYFVGIVLLWSDFALFNAGPCILIFVLNSSIVVKLTRPQTGRQNDKKAKKAASSLTVMLFVVSVIYLVTSTPITIFFLGEDKFFPNFLSDDEELADADLMYTVCSLVSYSNNSINFLLYFLSGERFRKAMADMFCARCVRKRPYTSSSTVSSKMSRFTTFVPQVFRRVHPS